MWLPMFIYNWGIMWLINAAILHGLPRLAAPIYFKMLHLTFTSVAIFTCINCINGPVVVSEHMGV